MIPKIIHHSAPIDRNKWNPLWIPCFETWYKVFPEDQYHHVLWGDDDCHNLVQEHYPEFWETYKAFPLDIMRWDFSRYCIMHKYGGIYADMDIYCYKNFYSYLEGYDLLLVQSISHTSDVENSLMASKPQMKFYYDCLDTSKKTFVRNEHINVEQIVGIPTIYSSYISNMTGINLLGSVYSWYKNDPSMQIGLLDFGLFLGNRLYYSDKIYTRHMCTDSWGGYNREKIDLNNFDFYTNYAGYE